MPAALTSLHFSSSNFVPPKTNNVIAATPFCARSLSNVAVSVSPSRMPTISAAFNPIKCSFSSIAPLEAILFDIDGTLCDSDPIHYDAFREMLQEIGYNGGVPISEEFFINKISGKHNVELCQVLFPDWDFEKAIKFMDDKEAYFRRLASKQLLPMNGLDKLCKWIDDRGLKRAAVTNAPRSNAEQLISMLALQDFFPVVIIGNECDRAKPFPDPYLKGLHALQVSPNRAFVFEDSVSGTKSGVSAGMQVIGVAARNPEQFLIEAGATFTIKDFEDSKLWAALEELDKKTKIIK